MTDPRDREDRSRLMRRVKQRNTKPEMLVRSLLHRLGYRFSLHRKDLPGTPDIVFPKRRLVLFVHGCFWHRHDCRRGRLPKTHLEYWEPKLAANKARDQRKELELTEHGWRVATVWECELDDMQTLSERLIALLSEPTETTQREPRLQ